MNLLLSGQHVDVSPALREYVKTKLDRVTRHFDRIIEIDVILGIEQPAEKDRRQRAEVNLRVKGKIFHLEHYAEDLYAAIDGLVDRLDRQVLRYKKKIQDHQQQPLKRVSGDEFNPVAVFDITGTPEISAEAVNADAEFRVAADYLTDERAGEAFGEEELIHNRDFSDLADTDSSAHQDRHRAGAV